MNRTTRMLLVLLVAVVLASAASFAVYRAVQRIPVRQVEVAQVKVVVAARSIPVGTVITRDQVKLVGWPASTPVTGAMSSVDSVVDRGAVVAIAENEPITESKLASKAAGGGLPPLIPPGMRALSVRVNDVIGVAGFVLPGTHVDVLVTVSQQGDSRTRTVVSDLLVLSTGTGYDQEAPRREGKAIPTAVVTLAVTPEDGERVTMAQTEGKIMLALRNPLDTQPTVTSGVRLSSLLGPPAPPPVETAVKGKRMVVAARPPAPAVPKVYTVEVFRGAKRTEETIK